MYQSAEIGDVAFSLFLNTLPFCKGKYLLAAALLYKLESRLKQVRPLGRICFLSEFRPMDLISF